ncbi:U-Kazal-Dg21.2 [Drosophila albomicans]|uniref:U-Kazal-Dg21.2 n=1 Tax=Drosophila albomicans TaxID=7291 RepID=A0A9C6TCH2_DROAB|nr:U-Kazal-Dg21.2 [Drosophila albomicans]
MKSAQTFDYKLTVVTFLTVISIIYGQLSTIEVPNKCHDVCPTGYRVVCGFHNGYLRTFASSCVMRMYNCKYQKGM